MEISRTPKNQYYAIKIRNGLWRVMLNGKKISEHTLRIGAEQAIERYTQRTYCSPDKVASLSKKDLKLAVCQLKKIKDERRSTIYPPHINTLIKDARV
jgi:hypothetical protein